VIVGRDGNSVGSQGEKGLLGSGLAFAHQHQRFRVTAGDLDWVVLCGSKHLGRGPA